MKFDVVKSTFEENLDKSLFEHPYQYAIATARGKTIEVCQSLLQNENAPDLIIGADTVVSMGTDVIEKPSDREHAVKMLSR